jgi:PPK2 family polyphosphate:nucleotide phosphotransferase
MSTNLDAIVKQSRKLARPYCVSDGEKFRLKDIDPGETGDLKNEDKPRAKEILHLGVEALATLQDLLYADDRWGVLLIFQAMDAAGKDSAIKHVMSGINPQGCQVASFKTPSTEELDHDFLWRCTKQLPERGRIGIFNRSYYEEVLVVRVHPELLEYQKIPQGLVGDDIWKDRFKEIRAFERHLSRNGFVIRKFCLTVSKKEQKKRFLERIDRPEKNWKFSAADVRERNHWKEYMKAYEEMICETATADAPWYVVPADNKWYTQMVVAAALVDALGSLDLCYPKLSEKQLEELASARKELLAE